MPDLEPLWVVKIRETQNHEAQISVDNGYWLSPERAKRLAAQLQVVLDAIETVFETGA